MSDSRSAVSGSGLLEGTLIPAPARTRRESREGREEVPCGENLCLGGLRRLISGVLPSRVVGFRKATALSHLRHVRSGAPVRAAVAEAAGGETLLPDCSGGGRPEQGSLTALQTQMAGPASQHRPPGATCALFPVLLFGRSVISNSVQPCDLPRSRLTGFPVLHCVPESAPSPQLLAPKSLPS